MSFQSAKIIANVDVLTGITQHISLRCAWIPGVQAVFILDLFKHAMGLDIPGIAYTVTYLKLDLEDGPTVAGPIFSVVRS